MERYAEIFDEYEAVCPRPAVRPQQMAQLERPVTRLANGLSDAFADRREILEAAPGPLPIAGVLALLGLPLG